MITLSLDAFFRRESADSRDWGMKALAAARAVGDPPLIAAAAAALALACAFLGAIEEAEPYRAEAAELVDGMSDAQLAARLDAIAYLTGAEAYMDRFEASTAHGERGLALARATGQGELLPMLIPARSTVLLGAGAAPRSGSACWTARSRARGWPATMQTLAWYLLNRSFVAALAGDLETAIATAEESFDMARPLGDNFVSTYARLVLGDRSTGDWRSRARAGAVSSRWAGRNSRRFPAGGVGSTSIS